MAKNKPTPTDNPTPAQVIEQAVAAQEITTAQADAAAEAAATRGPVVTLHGEGAEHVEFAIESSAKTIDVYADGTIVTNY